MDLGGEGRVFKTKQSNLELSICQQNGPSALTIDLDYRDIQH